jgi:hypothetical protein
VGISLRQPHISAFLSNPHKIQQKEAEGICKIEKLLCRGCYTGIERLLQRLQHSYKENVAEAATEAATLS